MIGNHKPAGSLSANILLAIASDPQATKARLTDLERQEKHAAEQVVEAGKIFAEAAGQMEAVEEREAALDEREAQLAIREDHVQSRQADLDAREQRLKADHEAELADLDRRGKAVSEREDALAEREKAAAEDRRAAEELLASASAERGRLKQAMSILKDALGDGE